MGAIGHDDNRFAAAAIDPQTMSRVECALPFALTAETLLPFAGLVVVVNEVGSIAIDQQETAVIQERKVGRQKTIGSPSLLGIDLAVFR